MEDVFTTAKLFMLGNSNSLEREILATVLYKFTPDVWNAVDLPKPAYDVTTMPPDEVPSPLRAPSKPLAIGGAVEAPLSADAIREGMGRLFGAFHHIPRVGSNNWAISGEHTASGRPLISGDPHQPLSSPNVMYMLHLNSADAGGQFDVVGWAFAGTPGVQLGHNRDVHWAATTNFGDVMDLWEVELLDGGAQVRLGDDVIDTVIRTETIPVAGGEDVVLDVIEVPGRGVILPDSLIPLPGIVEAGNGILVNWTGFAATAEERCFFEMNKATTLEEYEAAVDIMEVGGFNFVAASAEGITYRVNINVPDRQLGADGPYPFLIMDGSDASSLWTGDWLPPEQLPHSKGGSRGYLSSANNDPWGFTFDGDVNNDPWYYGYFYAPGYRAKRINDELDRLTADGGITVQDMIALQNDTHSGLADQIVPVLETAWANAQTDAALAEYAQDADLEAVVDTISGWDRTFPLDSREAVAFRAFSFYLAFELLQDDISLLYATIAEEEPIYLLKLGALTATGAYANGDDIIQDGIDVTVLEAATSTAAFLAARFGGVDPSNYVWSDVHFSTFANTYGGALDGGQVATAGSDDSVNVSQSSFYLPGSTVATDEWRSNDGPIFRVVTSFDADGTPVSVATTVRGNSGDPDSPHWDDEQADWVAGTPTPIAFRRGEVDAVTESVTMLEP
jgi:penicillin amidase